MCARKTKSKAKKGKKFLVIVESPTKVRTISRILPREYEIKSSMGHIVDLPPNRMGIYISKGFQPRFQVIQAKKKILEQIQKSALKKDKIFIATDPDREGEAIGYHIQRKIKKGKDKREFLRVEFHEITQGAVKEAFSSPRTIDMNLVNAQIARRILDRIVGYFLSPLLWRKIRGGLSAGRVQSVALRFIIERERKIQSFVPQEYWTLEAVLKSDSTEFNAQLVKHKGKAIKIDNEEKIKAVIEEVKSTQFIVDAVKKFQRARRSPAPFNTASLQQEAFNRLGFSARKTMSVAQQLYEGVSLPDGERGLITYMRTDSLKISQQAQTMAEKFIAGTYGAEYASETKKVYKTKKFSQEAHEAIRPTDVNVVPDSIKSFLTPEQFRLYDLIWRRFVASQTKDAVFSVMRARIMAGEYEFVYNAQKLAFDGFLKVWGQDVREDVFCPIKEQDVLELVRCIPLQHFTQPPARFTEATLVRLLEEKGIGRPSTYASIISTIIERNYVDRNNKQLVPTELGFLVGDLLIDHFKELMDEKFTAYMEEELDEVEVGKKEWHQLLEEFYSMFKPQLDKAYELIEKKQAEVVPGRKCPACGSDLIIKWGRYGKFISCSSYPECKHREPMSYGDCPRCDGKIVIRKSRKGKRFYACNKWPECNFTASSLKEIEKQRKNEPV